MISLMMVEDEKGAVAVFKNLLQLHDGDFNFLGAATSVSEAVKMIKTLKPQVLILDVSLPDGTGFDVLDILGEADYEVIFLTAHEQYAVQAIKKNAFDYILKPLQSKEMHEALNKVKLRIESKANKSTLEKIALHTTEGIDFINIKNIAYLKGASNYTEIYLLTGAMILASRTLKSFEEQLGNGFFRVQKSYIVNTKLIKRFDRSDATLYLENGEAIPVSKNKKEELMRLVAK
jgi:two-component system, LytTR family, response regulator